MLQFSDLNPELLNPADDSLVFRATLNAHGLYSTENFVLRLSPRVHELMDAILQKETGGMDRAEIVQAYSTYLHETLHWWQHVGSSAGLVLSLAYPAQVLGSMEFARSFGQIVGAVKPMKAWALRAEINGKSHEDPALQAANIAVNNALDINYYKQIAFNPQRTKELARSTPYFESVGHSYLKAYGDVLGAINGSCDFSNDEFPDPTLWEPEWDRLRQERCEGFVHGSMPPLAKVGLFAIFEGQARFSQIQFLASSGGPALLQTYREDGYFASPYGDAFEEFLQITGRQWPDRFDSPLVGLFLLICDLAINPTRGFPLDIEHFEDFIRDVDPGARFTILCLAAADQPELAFAIQKFNAIEYEYVAMRLAERCGYDDPREALDAVIALLGDEGPVDALMEEHRTFEYGLTNMPIRVMVSHYIAFCRDKRRQPELFCWPGIWMAASKATAKHQSLFLAHLSLFQDRGDTSKIFPRAMPGKTPDNLKRLVNGFYSSMLLFDMALQWAVTPGPFRYNFSWLTGESENPELVAGAKRQFVQIYGLNPDSFDLIDSPNVPTIDKRNA